MTKPIFIAAILLASLTTTMELRGQELVVKNVRFTQRDDSSVIVNYDLIGDPSKKYTVKLSIYMPDTRETIPLEGQSLFGNVGKNVQTGRAKKIGWDLLKDNPEGLHGSDFVFVVDAYTQKGGDKLSWLFVWLAAVGGGTAYFLIPRSEDTELDLPEPPALPGVP